MSQARDRQRETNEERLYRIFTTRLGEADLRKYCADLDLDYDQLLGNTYEEKARTLASIVAQQDLKTASRATAPQPKQRQLSPELSQIFDNWQRPSSRPHPPPGITPPLPPEPPIPRPMPNMPYPSFVRRHRRKLTYMALAIVLGLVVCSALQALILILPPRSSQQGVVEVTRLVEATRIVEVTRLVEVAVNQVQPVTGGEAQSETVQEQPTAVQPSPTPLPEPTGNTIVYTNDFERGLGPEWQPAYGTMGMSNGNLTATSPFDGVARNHTVILNDYIWEDFVLTTHLAPFDSTIAVYALGGILVRELADGQWIGFIIFPKGVGIGFATFDENGNYATQSGSLVAGYDTGFSLDERGGELRVEAYGNTYILYLDSHRITSATFPGPTASRIAIWIQNNRYDDDSDSYAPRFEDIRIESIP